MEKINLFGASGHGRVIKEIVGAMGIEAGCFYDDAPKYDCLAGIPVLKADEAGIKGPVIVSIGDNAARRRVAERLKADFATAVHPSAVVSPTSRIAEGTVVMQGAIVQANAAIGRHCIINTGVSIDHDCRIESFAHISPHATLCGGVTVGEGSWVGAGAVIVQGVKIGRWCVIGAGSVVLKDIPDGVTAYGNPCEVRRTER